MNTGNFKRKKTDLTIDRRTLGKIGASCLFTGMLGTQSSFANSLAKQPEQPYPVTPSLNLAKPAIGFLIYPDMFPMDVWGPLVVFESLMEKDIYFIAKEKGVIHTTSHNKYQVVNISADTSFEECPAHLDALIIPGGVEGTLAAMKDKRTLDFLNKKADSIRYLCSVCTGSLILGAAGLLEGYKATSHWAFKDVLSHFGAESVGGRVVVDRNRISAGGVTAGIDFGLYLISVLRNKTDAESIQLYLEYDPYPPFNSGNPSTAPKETVQFIDKLFENARERMIQVSSAP